LSCALEGDPKKAAWAEALAGTINTARIRCAWTQIAPTEGKFRWEETDAQLAWCRSARLNVAAGPLLELRPGALPDWLWLWQGDFEQIQSMVLDLVRAAVGRYRGKVATWHLVHRPGSGEVLGLSEEEQVRLTARVLQVARQVDSRAQLVVDFDRPWAEWMAS